jgi:hypothetical protein
MRQMMMDGDTHLYLSLQIDINMGRLSAIIIKYIQTI